MNNSDLARDIAIELATRVSAPTVGWSWSKGVVLFPEARCPFCKDVMKSRAVWLVRGNYLIGQAVPVAGQELVLDPPEHPHATSYVSPAAICMGNAVDPLQALFNGLNVRSSFFNPDDEITGGMCPWLRGPYWEHDCNEMSEAEDYIGEEDGMICDNCAEYFDPDDMSEFNSNYYCENCFNDHAFKCAGCRGTFSQDMRLSYDDDNYCSDCFYDRYFYCEGCSDDRPIDDRNEGADGDSYCDDCWSEKFFKCDACDDTFLKSNRATESLCLDCSSTCEQCQEWYETDTGDYCVYCIKSVCDSCSQLHGEQCNSTQEATV